MWKITNLEEYSCGLWIWTTFLESSVVRENIPSSATSALFWIQVHMNIHHWHNLHKCKICLPKSPSMSFYLINVLDYIPATPETTPAVTAAHPDPNTTTTAATSTTAKTTTTAVSGGNFCTGKPDGLYVNDEDGNSFYQCVDGITYLQRCQPNLIYKEICKCCDWP